MGQNLNNSQHFGTFFSVQLHFGELNYSNNIEVKNVSSVIRGLKFLVCLDFIHYYRMGISCLSIKPFFTSRLTHIGYASTDCFININVVLTYLFCIPSQNVKIFIHFILWLNKWRHSLQSIFSRVLSIQYKQH